MKNILIAFLIFSQIANAANETRIKGSSITTGSASIGTSSAASSKAALDVVSTTKGAALPRMSTAQRDAVTSPITGLEIYNTTLNQKQVYMGSAWVTVGAALGSASAPAASAVAESASTTQGILFPRMTTVQRDAISSPATGLVVYNTTTNHLNVYSGSAWVQFGAALGSASAPAASAVFEAASTTQGALFPRMTTVQRDAISSPATGLIVYNTTTSKFSFYSGTAWVDVGSGSGGGSINYVLNPDAEAGLSSVAAYADAAGTSPVDGTGGSPTMTVTQTSSSPLTGTNSFLITKDAANRQGNGVAWDFTIDRSALAKQHTVSFDYEVASGTYDAGSDTTDPDLTAWVYGPTDGTPALTQLAGYKVLGCASGVVCRFQGNFQTAASGVAYRLILHETKTGTSAYTFKLDSVSVSPVLRVFGAPVTDWAACTATGSWSTNTTYTAQCRRVGQNLEENVHIALAGVPTNANLTINIPSGLSIDTTAAVVLGTPANPYGRAMVFQSSSGNDFDIAVTHNNSTSIFLGPLTSSPTQVASGVDRTHPVTFASGDSIDVKFSVPIVGWASPLQLSQNTSSRDVLAKYRDNTGGISVPTGAGYTTVTFNTLVKDTHAAYSAGVITIPVSGWYDFKGQVRYDAAASANNQPRRLRLYNVTAAASVKETFIRAYSGQTFIIVDLAGDSYFDAGTQVRFETNHGEAGSESLGSGNVEFSMTRRADPTTMVATEPVAAAYYVSSDTAFNSTQINYDTKDYDTHNAVTTGAGAWKFAAPMPGIYRACATSYYSSGSLSDMVLNKNGSSYARIAQIGTSVTSSYPGCISLKLVAGDYIDVRTNASITLKGLIGGVRVTFISVERIGN